MKSAYFLQSVAFWRMHLNIVKCVKHNSIYVCTGAHIFNKLFMVTEQQTHTLEKSDREQSIIVQ